MEKLILARGKSKKKENKDNSRRAKFESNYGRSESQNTVRKFF